ncbi:hypothetical protein [Tessaracoccus sp.]
MSSALVSLSTRSAGDQFGIVDTQVQSVFHELKRDAAGAPAPDRDEYDAFVRRVRRTLTVDQARRVADRLTAAASTTEVPDGATFYAMQHVQVGAHVAEKALKSSMRRVAIRRLGEVHYPNDDVRRTLLAVETDLVKTRYDAFRRIADGNRNLRAPLGFIERFRETGTHTSAIPADRVTAYAVWRSGTTGENFAPAPPAGARWDSLQTSWSDLRSGDVIDSAGYSAPSDVIHEGKQVREVDTVPDPRRPGVRHARVMFTDGSHEVRSGSGSTFTVMRAWTPEHERQLGRYQDALRYSDETGVDETGAWVRDRHGELVRHP